LLGALVGAPQLGVAAECITEPDQFSMFFPVALNNVRVDSEDAAEGGNRGRSHWPCLWKWLTAGLSLEAERVEGGLGEFEIVSQVCDGEIDDAFSATARYRSAADVFDDDPGFELLDGVLEEFCDLGRRGS